MKFHFAILPVVYCSNPGKSLREIAVDEGGLSSHRLFTMGLAMVNVVQKLHTVDEMNHRHATAAAWFTGVNDDYDRVELRNLEHLRPLSKDPHGYHRVLEIQQLVLTLRYLVDLDERYVSIENLARPVDIDSLCPGIEACPFNLREIVEYALVELSPNRRLPRGAYVTMREQFRLGLRLFEHVTTISTASGPLPPVRDIELAGTRLTNPIGGLGGPRKFYALRETNRSDTSVEIDVIHVDNNEVDYNHFTAICYMPNAVPDLGLAMREAHYTSQLAGSKLGRSFYEIRGTCLIQEKFRTSLSDLAPLSFDKVAEIGLRMMFTIERLHKVYRLVHQNANLDNWRTTSEGLEELKLINYDQMASVDGVDQSGEVRLAELKLVVLHLVALLSPAEQDIASLGLPEEFTKMIQFVMGTTPDQIEKVYTRINRVLQLVGSSGGHKLGGFTAGSTHFYFKNRLDGTPSSITYATTRQEGVVNKSEKDIVLICGVDGAETARVLNAPWTIPVIGFVRGEILGVETNCVELWGGVTSVRVHDAVTALMGHRMLDILENLHTNRGLTHGGIRPGCFYYRKERPEDLVLIDFKHASPVEDDGSGIRRLQDLRNMVLVLRYWMDYDETFSLPDPEITPEDICANATVCSPSFAGLARLVYGADSAESIYEQIRQHLNTLE
jgi:hypothetical protein